MSGGGGTTLEYTPTWVVAAICTVIVAISLALERLLHYTGKVVQHFLISSFSYTSVYCFLGTILKSLELEWRKRGKFEKGLLFFLSLTNGFFTFFLCCYST